MVNMGLGHSFYNEHKDTACEKPPQAYKPWQFLLFSPSMGDMHITKYSRILLSAVLTATLLAGGCATGYVVQVDSIAAQPAPAYGKKYYLRSGMEDIPETDLYFQEFSNQLRQVLHKKGYTSAERIDDADIVLHFSYGVSQGENVYYTYVHPVYGFTGGGTVTYRETRAQQDGTQSTVTGVVSYPLRYHVVGYTQETGNELVFTSFYSLEAGLPDKEAAKAGSLWKTTVKTTAPTADLRTTMPIMLHASAPYVGENTGTEKLIHLQPEQVTPTPPQTPPMKDSE